MGSQEVEGTIHCTKCGIEKPFTAEFFPKCGRGRWLARTCKQCRSEAYRKWKLAQGEEGRIRRRRLYPSREKVKKLQRHSARWKRDPLYARARVLRDGILTRHKRGVPADLSLFTVPYLEKMLSEQPNCACCGRPFQLQPDGSHGPSNGSPSLDRINPEHGYVSGNTALICWRCNNLKRDSTSDELQVVVDWMKTVGR